MRLPAHTLVDRIYIMRSNINLNLPCLIINELVLILFLVCIKVVVMNSLSDLQKLLETIFQYASSLPDEPSIKHCMGFF